MDVYPAHLHRPAVRLPSQRGRTLLRRRPRPQVDAEDSRHPQAQERQRHLHAHRRRGRGECRPHAAHRARRQRDRQPHLHAIPTSAKSRNRQLDLEVKLTERLFASKLGVQPLYFRPPYDIDEEPDTDDQAAPAWRIQQTGYIIIGSKIDTDDWNEHPRKTAAGDHPVRPRPA